MLKYKLALILIITSLLINGALSQSYAITGTSTPVVAASSSTKMTKVIGFVKKIENNVLYLENNKSYDLRNVKVTESPDRNNRISNKKWVAEMLFVNGALKEVNIR